MKKKSLSIEKFRIAKLNNSSKITGGNSGPGDDVTVVMGPDDYECKEMSDVLIIKK